MPDNEDKLITADEEYFGRYGQAVFALYDAVEIIGDDGFPCRAGIVVRVHNSLMGWRYEVSMLQARAYVGIGNLRKLPPDTVGDRQLPIIDDETAERFARSIGWADDGK